MLSDEGMGSSNSECLSLVLWQLIEALEVKEYLSGFYRLDNIGRDHTVCVIKVNNLSTPLKIHYKI